LTYQLKITLQEIDPPVWRRLLVPGSITFAQLHDVIQAAFGWLGYHLFGFEFPERLLVMKTEDMSTHDYWGNPLDYRDPEKTVISTLLEAHDACLYTYDFGDGWRHDVVVEKRLKRSKRGSVPICLGGARHRPPEDVGGVGGYESFLRTISNPKNPKRGEMLSWAEKDTGGRLFDPEYFYLPEINRRLAHAREDNVQGELVPTKSC